MDPDLPWKDAKSILSFGKSMILKHEQSDARRADKKKENADWLA